jgi:hypothetical protein
LHLLRQPSTFLLAGDLRPRRATQEEVDDVKSSPKTLTPATGLSSYVAQERSCTAPMTAAHGTLVSFAGAAAAQVAVLGARFTDLTGSVPRGAPV